MSELNDVFIYRQLAYRFTVLEQIDTNSVSCVMRVDITCFEGVGPALPKIQYCNYCYYLLSYISDGIAFTGNTHIIAAQRQTASHQIDGMVTETTIDPNRRGNR